MTADPAGVGQTVQKPDADPENSRRITTAHPSGWARCWPKGAPLSGGYSLVEAADSLGDTWSPLELLEVETGRRPVLDPDLEVLTDLYGIPTTSLIPERSRPW